MFAELAGDGLLAKTVRATAAALGLNLRPVLQAQTFGHLVAAVESGTAAAFLPEAAKSLPEERFAVVSAEGMHHALDRSLSTVWNEQVAESRPSVRRAIAPFRRVLA